jgi:hypothetical protein
MTGPHPVARAVVLAALAAALAAGRARADDADVAPVGSVAPPSAAVDDGEYRTPRAGEAYDTQVFGQHVHVPARDRTRTLALSLGALSFTPQVGDQSVVPFAALYASLYGRERRFRAVVSGLVDEADYAEHLVSGLEGLLHFENDTIPFPTTEIVDGKDLSFSALTWGYTALWGGLGWRVRVPPAGVDNDLRLEVFYQARYYYFASAHDTDPALGVPPDTYVHGVRVRLRLDMITRNIFEMPHEGFALGFEGEFVRRDRWEDYGPLYPDGSHQFLERDTRDYTRLAGYVVVACGIPFLSERHRLIAQVHAGWAPRRDLDRFSAFRIGGGPQPTEASDLARGPYPGAMFDQFIALSGIVTTIEYRVELLFFLYLHLRATYAWGKIPTYHGTAGPPGPVKFTSRGGTSASAGITSGFFWNSSIYVEYAYDTGTVRANRDGHTVMFMWSKSF